MTQGLTEETIFALASGKGRAGVAVVRVSGPACVAVSLALTGQSVPAARTAVVRRLHDPDDTSPAGLIDQALILWMPGPDSFTGEDVLELHIHGGTSVLEALLNSLSKIDGCRHAEPGEFTRRAFEHGKMDLTEAEGLNDLILAETISQRQQSLQQMQGSLSRLYDGWRRRLIEIVAHVEIGIDFSDEDVPDDLLDEARGKTADVSREIDSHLRDASRGQLIREGFSIAIVGHPNVGKSSLLNALAQDDVAIVSHVEGTTRDSLSIRMDLGGFAVTIYDTAGIRVTEDDIEREGVRRARARAENANLRLYIYDASQPASLDLNEVEKMSLSANEGQLGGVGKGLEATLLIANKSDLLCAALRGDDGPALPYRRLYVSARSGEGLAELKTELTQVVAEALASSDAPALTRARHRSALEDCRASLVRFETSTATDPALLAEDLRMAVRALGRITGRVDVEDMLDVVFSQFCIGK